MRSAAANQVVLLGGNFILLFLFFFWTAYPGAMTTDHKRLLPGWWISSGVAALQRPDGTVAEE